MVTLRTNEKGRYAIHKEYEQLAVDYLYEHGKPVGSGKVFIAVLDELRKHGKTISRASIIGFLKKLGELKLVTTKDTTGKGGHHTLYHANLDRKDFEQRIFKTIVDSALEALPLVDLSFSF